MSLSGSTDTGYISLPVPFPEVFSDEDVSSILEEIKRKINIKFSKDDDVPKTILVDTFGTQNSGKTTITGKIEQLVRRHKFKAFCPPETAEIESVRNQLTSDPMISQAIHLNGVDDRVLNLSHHPRVHFSMISRGLIDMLYWYERDRRKGVYSDVFCQSISDRIYNVLRMDLVDCFLFFTCSVEAAMKREYNENEALTQRRGSKMNEKEVAETIDIYNTVLGGVNKNVPGLPIFHVDTSSLSVREVGQEVLRFLLPTICKRFSVSSSGFMTGSKTLMRKSALHSRKFEEQLKLKGHPSREKLEAMGWIFEGKLEQEDIYLNYGSSDSGLDSRFGEIVRIRKDERGSRFVYKSQAWDRMLFHRNPLTFNIEPEDEQRLRALYPVIVSLTKIREHFELHPSVDGGDQHFFSLHIDTMEGLGLFTEIRALGTSEKTHTSELLALATELGFSPSDIVEGSYLALALKK